jgi:hypothetical protein
MANHRAHVIAGFVSGATVAGYQARNLASENLLPELGFAPILPFAIFLKKLLPPPNCARSAEARLRTKRETT